MTDIVYLDEVRLAKGLPVAVRPADVLLPAPGKQIGDRVRMKQPPWEGTVIAAGRGMFGFFLTIATSYGNVNLPEDAVVPAAGDR